MPRDERQHWANSNYSAAENVPGTDAVPSSSRRAIALYLKSLAPIHNRVEAEDGNPNQGMHSLLRKTIIDQWVKEKWRRRLFGEKLLSFNVLAVL